MQQIINFIIRNKTFLLFLLLFSLSILFTIQSHSYHRSKFINSANFLSGGLYNSLNNLSSYFNLKSQNLKLAEENKLLRSIIFNAGYELDSIFTDSVKFTSLYKFRTAQVIKNSYSLNNNILTINKGKNDSVKEDLGVISTKGIVGIVNKTSKNYATVISILNTTSKISAKLKRTNHFGTLIWDGNSPQFAQLIDIPKVAPVLVGDTIVTSGRSAIFPKGVLVGTIEDYKLDTAENYFTINIRLFNDMTNLEHVYVIENVDHEEISNLTETNE